VLPAIVRMAAAIDRVFLFTGDAPSVEDSEHI
jgi:hypothetical protein